MAETGRAAGTAAHGERNMDQVRTEKFLKELRTERGWTQSRLAGQLGVSEKMVSKWETGRGLPEVSLMLPVCEALGITVNELLAGERLSAEAYRERAEERLLLTCDRTNPKTKVIICNAACWVSVVVWLVIIFIAAFCDLPVWARITVIVCAFLGITAVIAPILVVAVNTEIYTCPKCRTKFVPTLSAFLLSPHTTKKRRLKCPHCGQKSWCESSLRPSAVQPGDKNVQNAEDTGNGGVSC